MKKTLLIALLMVLMAPFAMNAQENPKDMWDFVTSFSTSTGRQHAIAYDGEFIYTAAWGKSTTVLSMFYKYDMDGNLLDEFDVAGVTNSDNYVRDMTYDGQYFYGCDAHSGKIWCYDLHNKTLVEANAINTSYTELGTCTYDPVYDAFWVGERAIGSAPFYLDLKLIDRSGTVIKIATQYAFPPCGSSNYTVHGTAYFTDNEGSAHIYLFAVAGFTAHVFDYDIDTDQLNTSILFDFSATPGWSYACSAGGAYIGLVNGSQYFFGDVDKSPNLIGIYALDDYTPVVPTPPEGDIFFDFEDSMIHFSTIDADGDGYNWELRTNWGNYDNRYSLTSASFDDLTQTVLFPENYLVTPYKLDCEQIVFMAQAQDATSPNEHFGVAVSTTEATSSNDFTIVWETDLTAKEAGGWHTFNVDLRDYQGQDIYVSIVHFNCSNQFMLNIDNVTLYRTYNNLIENAFTSVSVYPNPASDKVVIESQVIVNQYNIYNIAGEKIFSATVNEKSFEVNVSEIPVGAYIIRLTSEGMVESRRFIKK